MFGVLFMVMGMVIGVGVFFKVVSVVGYVQLVSLVIFVWVLGGVLIICVGLISVEFVIVIFEIGGVVKYIEYIYGKLVGFFLGWV